MTKRDVLGGPHRRHDDSWVGECLFLAGQWQPFMLIEDVTVLPGAIGTHALVHHTRAPRPG